MTRLKLQTVTGIEASHAIAPSVPSEFPSALFHVVQSTHNDIIDRDVAAAKFKTIDRYAQYVEFKAVHLTKPCPPLKAESMPGQVTTSLNCVNALVDWPTDVLW